MDRCKGIMRVRSFNETEATHRLPVSPKTISVEEITCNICFNVFEKPSMLDCGHSFCSECVMEWLESHASCPTCRKAVNKTIRNISLEKIVEQHHRTILQENAVRLRKSNVGSGMEEKMFVRAPSRRCRFSLTNDIVHIEQHDISNSPDRGDPITIQDAESVAELVPHSSDCVFDDRESIPIESPDLDFCMDEEGELTDSENELENHYESIFHRDDMLRRSEKMLRSNELSADSDSSSAFKRASASRRSVNIIRSSGWTRRNQYSGGEQLCSATSEKRDAGEAVIMKSSQESSTAKRVSKSKIRALLTRLVPFKIKRRNRESYAVHPSSSANETCNRQLLSHNGFIAGSLCSYYGAGRHFQRISRGDEIAIVVFGRRAVGKTTFLDNVALSVEAAGVHCIMRTIDRNERMLTTSSGGTARTGAGAHIISFIIQSPDRSYVVDVIDAECDVECKKLPIDAPVSYQQAADAAVLLYSSMDPSSTLPVMATHRQLAKRQIPCVVVGNVYSAMPRMVKEAMGRNIAKNNMHVDHWEVDLSIPGQPVLDVLRHICSSVLKGRGESCSALTD